MIRATTQTSATPGHRDAARGQRPSLAAAFGPCLVPSLVATAAALTIAVFLAAPVHAQDLERDMPQDPAPAEELGPPQLNPDPGLDAPFELDPDGPSSEATIALDEIEDPEEALARAFEDLKSEDEAVWRPAQDFIAKVWTKSGSDSMDLLLLRGRTAMEAEDWPRAVEHLTDLVNLAPDFAEGWNTRATAYFREGDYGASLADIAETLALEPRHFGALAGLGLILSEIGEDKKAVAAYRKALELNPHLDGPAEAVKQLAPSVDGRDA